MITTTPADPEDGFWHYGQVVTVTVARSRSGAEPERVEVCLRSWVPEVEGELEPVVIEVSVSPEGGPEMTPAEARELVGILIQLSIQAEAARRHADGAVPGS